MRICNIEKCNNKYNSNGFCRKHLARYKRHGNPLGGQTGRNEVPKFMLDAIATNTDECIIWPYSLRNGYGSIHKDGKSQRANRVVLTLTKGQAPKDKPLSLHSCNQPKCINKRHLRWGSWAENEQDKILDGTALTGQDRHNAKFTNSQAQEILTDKRTTSTIAKQYGVHRDTIYKIKKGINWKHLRR